MGEINKWLIERWKKKKSGETSWIYRQLWYGTEESIIYRTCERGRWNFERDIKGHCSVDWDNTRTRNRLWAEQLEVLLQAKGGCRGWRWGRGVWAASRGCLVGTAPGYEVPRLECGTPRLHQLILQRRLHRTTKSLKIESSQQKSQARSARPPTHTLGSLMLTSSSASLHFRLTGLQNSQQSKWSLRINLCLKWSQLNTFIIEANVSAVGERRVCDEKTSSVGRDQPMFGCERIPRLSVDNFPTRREGGRGSERSYRLS